MFQIFKRKGKCKCDLVDKVRRAMIRAYGQAEAHNTGYRWVYGGVRGCDNMHEVKEFLTDANFHDVVEILSQNR